VIITATVEVPGNFWCRPLTWREPVVSDVLPRVEGREFYELSKEEQRDYYTAVIGGWDPKAVAIEEFRTRTLVRVEARMESPDPRTGTRAWQVRFLPNEYTDCKVPQVIRLGRMRRPADDYSEALREEMVRALEGSQ